MVADGARNQHHVAGSRTVATQFQTVGQDTDGGRGDEDAVTLAALHDLGVTRHYRHAGRARCMRHRFDDARQVGQRKAFFQNESGGEIKRCRTHHRDIVDRTVYRETADIATGEEQGRDNMAVSGHHEACRFAVQHGSWQHGAVVALTQVLVAQMAREQFRDQLHHGAAAGAMRQIDPTVLQIEWPHIASFDVRHQLMSL